LRGVPALSRASSYLVNQSAKFVPVPVGFLADGGRRAADRWCVAAGLGAIDDLFDLRARYQLLGQVALACGRSRSGSPSTSSPTRSGAPCFVLRSRRGRADDLLDRRDDQQHQLDRRPRRPVDRGRVHRGVDPRSDQPDHQVGGGQPTHRGPLLRPRRGAAGFLRWNFNPASIFTGTSGVQFVGYTLACARDPGTAKVAVALLVLGVPIIDTFWIIVRRIQQGRSPFSPDRTHIHHRLLDLGLSHRQTVLAIYGICLALAVLSLLLSGVTSCMRSWASSWPSG
jgi:hypothetical protein